MPPSDRHRRLLRLLLQAYPDRVTRRRENDPARGVMVGNRGVVLDPSSGVRESPLFLSLDPREVENRGGPSESRVRLASAIEEEWLAEVFPHLVERRIEHRVDPKQEKVLSFRAMRFADLTIREDCVGPSVDPEGAARALAVHLAADPRAFLASDPAAEGFARRVRFLARHVPELGLPTFGTEDLRTLIVALAEGCTTAEAVRRRGIRRALENALTRSQRVALDTHAPETLEVPSGKRIRLRYPDDDGKGDASNDSGDEERGDARKTPTPPNTADPAPVVLAVRLQEVFGWKETPRLARGRAPVLLHLLGPNFRPVQITRDLANFWNTTYAEVRKDLRARYPRHSWPEDPWTAAPPRPRGS